MTGDQDAPTRSEQDVDEGTNTKRVHLQVNLRLPGPLSRPTRVPLPLMKGTFSRQLVRYTQDRYS